MGQMINVLISPCMAIRLNGAWLCLDQMLNEQNCEQKCLGDMIEKGKVLRSIFNVTWRKDSTYLFRWLSVYPPLHTDGRGVVELYLVDFSRILPIITASLIFYVTIKRNPPRLQPFLTFFCSYSLLAISRLHELLFLLQSENIKFCSVCVVELE